MKCWLRPPPSGCPAWTPRPPLAPHADTAQAVAWVSVVVFYLGVGLAGASLLGMLLWAVAGAIGVLNVKWMLTRDSS